MAWENTHLSLPYQAWWICTGLVPSRLHTARGKWRRLDTREREQGMMGREEIAVLFSFSSYPSHLPLPCSVPISPCALWRRLVTSQGLHWVCYDGKFFGFEWFLRRSLGLQRHCEWFSGFQYAPVPLLLSVLYDIRILCVYGETIFIVTKIKIICNS